MTLYVKFWVDGRAWYLTGVDGDGFVTYSTDARDAVAVESVRVARICQRIVEEYEPDKVVLDRRELQ